MPVPHHSVFFTGRMPFLPPNQQRQSTEGGAYRPPNCDMGYQDKLCSHLEDTVHSSPGATIWFAGDLNFPDIDSSVVIESITGHHYPKYIKGTLHSTTTTTTV